jgi:CLIP-associating protein 1/2
MNGLDATAQKLLNNDQNNPNSPKKPEVAARPGLGLSKSTMGTGKPSLREAMLAQKKALVAKNIPARPGSAMAHFSPVRTVSNSSTVSASSTATAPPTRQRPESTVAVGSGSGGMSVAPMRPVRKRPEMAARPATAGPYSVRTHDGHSAEANSPDSLKAKTMTPKPLGQSSPKRTATRPRPGHAPHASDSSLPSPTRGALTKPVPSPRGSPVKLKQSHSALPSSSPSKNNEELTLVVPTIGAFKTSPPKDTPTPPRPVVQTIPEDEPDTPSRTLKVYEDPFTDDQTTPRQTFTGPVLEDIPVNEDAAAFARADDQNGSTTPVQSPEKARQTSRLLDSGITRVKAKSLDVHGFRKLQSLIRENKAVFSDEKFDAMLLGLFEYLEAPLANLSPEKVQDVKAQILATIKLLLKKERDNFQPHVSRGLESLLRSRSAYDSRTHIVSGLELLADELVTLGDAPEIVMTLTKMLQTSKDTTVEGCRCLSMGLHVLKEMLDKRASFVPAEGEIAQLAGLAGRCIDSTESGVRMDAVQLCVALHSRVGDPRFWAALKGVKDDPRSLITYYIVKRQRERDGVAV